MTVAAPGFGKFVVVVQERFAFHFWSEQEPGIDVGAAEPKRFARALLQPKDPEL